METIDQNNPLNARVFEIPDPPEEFGQDGGKFYRRYDDLADEIDDDMVTGLKEQLEGLLIFAGLFAGINTAFLALTLPLLSADSSDDTNTLLAQNNALLAQLVAGRNDSVPTMPPLPSAGFSPPHDIFIINALFALSLAFAIISSFLAVLGRQWLVYYRKRSGGGPNSQRWEQLRRYLGAERWRLQPILDDVLPSLLQIGLIIFCASLILYLRHLSPTIAVIVGIPMCVGLAFFIGSALCTLWDKFCPFHSPLSHTLLGVRTIFAFGAIKGFKWRDLISADTTKRWFRALVQIRREESLETLQIITLQRAIRTSDDPATLLYATANIMGISNPSQMELLWSDETFQERFLDQFKNSYDRVLQLQGRDKIGMAVAARRLYCGVAAHIMLLLDSNRRPAYDLTKVQTAKGVMISTPQDGHSECSAGLVRATLRFPVPQLDRSSLPDEAVKDIGNYLITYSDSNTDPVPVPDPERRLFSVIIWAVFDLHTVQGLKIESPPQPYGCHDVESMIQTLDKAFEILTGPECGDLVDSEVVLMNMLRGIRQIIVVNPAQSTFTLHQKFALLDICEPILQSPRVSEATRQEIRNIRLDLAKAWKRKGALRAANKNITARLVDMLEQYLARLRTVYQADSGCNEYIEVLQAFGPGIRELFSYDPKHWASMAGMRARIAFHKNFNAFVYDVDRLSRNTQRDPDERWCHWQEPTSIRAVYSQPSDPPDSWWARMQQRLERSDSSSSPIPLEHSQSF